MVEMRGGGIFGGEGFVVGMIGGGVDGNNVFYEVVDWWEDL